jgi:hypothetical protein
MEFYICEEILQKDAEFSHIPYEILTYIEGDECDYIKYKVEKVYAIENHELIIDR